MNCLIAFYGQRHWPEYLHQLTRVCTGTRINVVTETEQDFNERGLSDSSWKHLLLWECADILIALGSLSMQPFWAKDGNRKCAVFPLNLTSLSCIFIFKSLFTERRLVWKSGSGHCPGVRNVHRGPKPLHAYAPWALAINGKPKESEYWQTWQLATIN